MRSQSMMPPPRERGDLKWDEFDNHVRLPVHATEYSQVWRLIILRPSSIFLNVHLTDALKPFAYNSNTEYLSINVCAVACLQQRIWGRSITIYTRLYQLIKLHFPIIASSPLSSLLHQAVTSEGVANPILLSFTNPGPNSCRMSLLSQLGPSPGLLN